MAITALAFETNEFCGFAITHYAVVNDSTDNEEIILACIGIYTFNGTTGSIHFTDTTMTRDMGNATFSISGDTLTLNYNNETYTLNKGSFSPDPNPDPDPQPGNELNNTSWMNINYVPYDEDEYVDTIAIIHVVAFAYGQCLFSYNNAENESFQYMGQYTFENGNGSATLISEENGSLDVTFTVNGNTMDFTYNDTTITLEKQEYSY